MNLQHIRVLTRHALHRSFASANGVLFMVLYTLVWFMVFRGMASEHINELGNPQGNFLVSLITSSDLAQVLFIQNPPSLGFFFIIALFLTPGFVMWGAGDQTASDISNRYMRFLIPRCGRLEIYVGRFLGAVIFTLIVQAVIIAVAMLIALSVDNSPSSEIIAYGIRISMVMLMYTIPFVALMSAMAAITGSVTIGIMSAMAGYAIMMTLSTILAMKYEFLSYLGWLFPSGMKDLLMTGGMGTLVMCMLLLLGYTLVYLIAGWYVFKRRDI